jgi:hypothetical protein
MSASPLTEHISGARKRLAHLSGLADKSEQAERAIRDAAQKRLAAVETDMRKLQPRVVTDDDAGKQFAALLTEKGQLMIVIAKARQVLAQ